MSAKKQDGALPQFSEFVVVKPFRLERHVWEEVLRAAQQGFRKGPEQLRLILAQWQRERVRVREGRDFQTQQRSKGNAAGRSA